MLVIKEVQMNNILKILEKNKILILEKQKDTELNIFSNFHKIRLHTSIIICKLQKGKGKIQH